MSIGPASIPGVRRPTLDRDLAELFTRVDLLERVPVRSSAAAVRMPVDSALPVAVEGDEVLIVGNHDPGGIGPHLTRPTFHWHMRYTASGTETVDTSPWYSPWEWMGGEPFRADFSQPTTLDTSGAWETALAPTVPYYGSYMWEARIQVDGGAGRLDMRWNPGAPIVPYIFSIVGVGMLYAPFFDAYHGLGRIPPGTTATVLEWRTVGGSVDLAPFSKNWAMRPVRLG